MDHITVQIDNLVELAIEYGDFTKLEGIESVRTIRATMSLQLYIICDNGDVIQLIYEFGSRKIYATLVGMHRSNDASIPVCRDKYAREELICKLMDETLYPFVSSNRLQAGVIFPGYPFWDRGHVVYYVKCRHMDIRRVRYTFKGLIKDVLRKHKDGVLLDIANVRVGISPSSPKEITERWVLC